MNALLDDDQKGFAAGNATSVIGAGLKRVSAQDIATAYEENAAAADQAYLNRQLLVTGVVASINSGLGDRPYIADTSI